MDRWTILGALIIAVIFVLFAFFRVESLDSRTVQALIACFIFAFYCGLVALGTAEKKRRISTTAQTMLGVVSAAAIAAVFGASAQGYTVAVVLGVVLGFTADIWAKYVQTP